MSFFEWLESTALSEWVSISPFGYPMLLAMHSVGMAIIVGILIIINLRITGFFISVPISGLTMALKLAWVGFIINFTSGLALFIAQATHFITHVAFIIKIAAIFFALINAAILQNAFRQHAYEWDAKNGVPLSTKIIAFFSFFLWLTAIIAGRLIAYI